MRSMAARELCRTMLSPFLGSSRATFQNSHRNFYFFGVRHAYGFLYAHIDIHIYVYVCIHIHIYREWVYLISDKYNLKIIHCEETIMFWRYICDNYMNCMFCGSWNEFIIILMLLLRWIVNWTILLHSLSRDAALVQWVRTSKHQFQQRRNSD